MGVGKMGVGETGVGKMGLPQMPVWSLYAQFSEDQDTVIKPQMPLVKCKRNSWMLYEVSDIKIFQYFLLIG